jgi:hypothetical protein
MKAMTRQRPANYPPPVQPGEFVAEPPVPSAPDGAGVLDHPVAPRYGCVGLTQCAVFAVEPC